MAASSRAAETSPARRRALPVAIVVAVLGLAACRSGGTDGDPRVDPVSSPPAPPERSASAVSSAPSDTADPGKSQDDATSIQIAIDGRRFLATLDDSAAARDLLAQLPTTIDMRDHGGVEKTGPLPSPLSVDGQPEGADPDVGDVGYYAPGNDLVLYYGDQSYYRGIVVLGRLKGDAAARIAELDGSVTAVIESASN
jgi:hypothetical protein